MLTKPYQKIATHGLIRKGDKFLVTLRSPENDYKPNEWDLPGGTIEFGEGPEKALKREILEESGLKVEIGRPLYIVSQTKDSRHQFWIVYNCRYKEGVIKLNPEEHSEFRWVSNKEAEKLKKIYFLKRFYQDCLIK